MSFRRIVQSAVFELFDAVRSRRALVLVILYLVISLLTMGGTIAALGKMEDQLAETLQIEKVEGKSGIVSATLWKSKPFQKLVRRMVDDKQVYDGLVGRHPAELIYAWLVFLMVPLLTILFTSNRIAGDVRSGSVRYMLTRVTRLEWVFGKYLGNAALVLAGLLLGAVSAWGVAAWKLAGTNVATLLPAMLLWSVKAWTLALSWLGLSLGISQIFQTPAKADGLATLALFAWSVAPKTLSLLADWSGSPVLMDVLVRLFPSAHEDGLWHMTAWPMANSALWLLALGLLYLSAGYAVFVRRDAR